MRGDERFAATVGAAHEVVVRGRALVGGVNEGFGDGGGFADGLVGEVQPCLLVGAEVGRRRRVAAIHADHGVATHQRRGGVGFAPGNAADGRGDEAIHAAAALEEEAVVPGSGQAELEADAVGLAIRAGARAVFAFDEAVRPGFLAVGGAAGEGGHFVGGNVAVAPFGAVNAGVGNGGVFQRSALGGVKLRQGGRAGGSDGKGEQGVAGHGVLRG